MTCKRESELLAEIEQTGAMYKVSTLKLIKAGSRIAELEALNSALCRDNSGLTQERDDLASQNQALRDALGEAMGWNWLSDVESIPESVSNQLADALTLPDTSDEILRARDARVNAELLYALAAGQDAFDEGTGLLPFQMRKMAEDLEENNG